jgi:transcriptional regulator with XRE-family HTH domain
MKGTPAELGARIKQYRKAAHISQTELAKKLGKTLRTVQKYESGEIEPSLSIINVMAWELNTTPSALIGYDKNDVRLDSLADIFSFFYQLNEKNEVHFEIEERIPSQDGERSCIIRFDARDNSADGNAAIYHFLREFETQRHMMETYWTDHEGMESWFDRYCASYADDPLTNKTYEELDELTRLQRRNELDRQMMEAKRKAAEENGD